MHFTLVKVVFPFPGESGKVNVNLAFWESGHGSNRKNINLTRGVSITLWPCKFTLIKYLNAKEEEL